MIDPNLTPITETDKVDVMIGANLIELIRGTANQVVANIMNEIPFNEVVEPITSELVGSSLTEIMTGKGGEHVE